jgi:O-6-methylguanine DNA methyltransferase
MSRRELRFADFALTLDLNAEGTLVCVTLPRQIPVSLDAQTLRDAMAALDRYSFAPDDRSEWTWKVWNRVRQIPWGSAMTYSELAASLGAPRAARAVAQACAHNPRLLAVPCHRIIAETGPGGFALGIPWKQLLLELETE